MRGVQLIVRTGRTVLCTTHQPSISIVEVCDGLLLLEARGIHGVYFGYLGDNSVIILEYTESSPGAMYIPPQSSTARRTIVIRHAFAIKKLLVPRR
ncbi:hypothetical protein CCR75_007493 [Bremia lactucae]|uniref:Uncharacterized protein n=1 Tax=Bremia lactucae TaxID=4779 RepID=A0A976FG28_BRELC|nr:hypothetical protein CCR75_007493 [Bremia lactucae]